jgi:hypothetical protein
MASMTTIVSEKIANFYNDNASGGRLLQNSIDDQPTSRMFVWTYCLTHMHISKN